MKKFIILPIILIVALASCKKKNTATNTTENTEDKVAEKVNQEELQLLIFSKSTCYGKCPAYTATITPDGKVDFNGIRFTPVMGSHEFKMKLDVIEQILAKADKIKFYELEDEYDNKYVTDIPSTTLKIQTNERTKEVYARHQIPEELNELNTFIHNHIMTLARKKEIYLNNIKDKPNRNSKGVIISDKPPVKPEDK